VSITGEIVILKTNVAFKRQIDEEQDLNMVFNGKTILAKDDYHILGLIWRKTSMPKSQI